MSQKKDVNTVEQVMSIKRLSKHQARKKLQRLQKSADKKAYLTEYSLETLIDALNIESAFLFGDQFKQNKVVVKKVSENRYAFAYMYEYTPSPDFEGLTLSLRSNDGEIYHGRVYFFDPKTYQVYFKCEKPLKTEERYTVTYETIRYLTDLCINAIRSVQELGLEKYFTTFNDEEVTFVKKRNIKAPKKWINPKIGQDLIQQETVMMILNESAYPNPFVVTGGPGTGKTSVIIEAVVQIVNSKSKGNILITCQSNAACDEVAIRLLTFLPNNKVFRYYSKQYFLDFQEREENYSKDSYFDKLCQNSTIKRSRKPNIGVEFDHPTKEKLMTFKIIVATMTSTASLVRNDFPTDHFSFIFIDECGAAIEPECLIPIVSLGMEEKKVKANIILVGDDKSLGPILNCPLAKGLGLEQSLIERIMRLELYNPENKKSKGRIAKFTNNYRSHPEIFKYSNETFYETSMDSMVAAHDYKLAMKWKHLPNPDIPIIFHSINAESMGNHDGLSWNNADEVELVYDYVANLLTVGLPECKKITQDQIGVASPYRAQVKLLRDRLRRLPRIDIGTTEFFQGREKPIMIISAAKSRNLAKTQDFLDNPRRLNVLLTRAKSLMIIIGNLEKLKLISSWERFIEHCIKSGLARRGPLIDDVDVNGQVLMERFSLLRIQDDVISSDDESIVERVGSDDDSADEPNDVPLQEGFKWNDAL